MKKLLLFVFFTSAAFYSAVAQTRESQTKPVPKNISVGKPTIPVTFVTEIPADEWGEIVKTLEAENWNKSSMLTSTAIKKLKADNEKKQLARLRYLYIYSLAGKIAQKTMPAAELERISQAFIGQDFLMPSRQVLSDCTEKVNYVCAVKADDSSLRVTATNKAATAIHSFEYVKLSEKFDVASNNDKKAFLGGKLKKLEIGNYKNGMKIVKLYFEDGYADVVNGQN